MTKKDKKLNPNGDQVETLVFKTKNLDQFKLVKGNRKTNPAHIQRLASSISEMGFLCSPILVNENLEVIDGQNRLAAAKKCDFDVVVYYMIVDNYSLAEVQALNLNQRNWRKQDYMESFAADGVEPYVKLKSFCEKNKDFSFATCLRLCSNSTHNDTGTHYPSGTHTKKNDILRVSRKDFHSGNWKGKDFELAQKWANDLRKLKPYFSKYNNTTFVKTMVGLFKTEEFDYNRFLRKVKLCGHRLKVNTTVDDTRINIDSVYNYKSRDILNIRYL